MKEPILKLIKEQVRIVKKLPLRIDESNEHALEEGWKENIIALATAAAGLVGSVKGQSSLRKYDIPLQTQITQPNKDTLRIDFGTTFKAGRYTFSKEKIEELSNKFKQISQFLTNHPNANFKINIIASESKVPNYDMEPNSVTFKQKLSNGELANKRAEAIKIALNTFENNLRNEGIKFGKINILPPKTLIGGPEWKQGEKSNDPKYIEHQYVKIEIIAENIVSKGFDFSAFATENESMFDLNRHIIARIFVRTRETNDINQQGNTDTGHEDVLVRFVNGNTGKFIGEDYLLKSSWWNKNVGTSNQMNNELMLKIKQNGKKIF